MASDEKERMQEIEKFKLILARNDYSADVVSSKNEFEHNTVVSREKSQTGGAAERRERGQAFS